MIPKEFDGGNENFMTALDFFFNFLIFIIFSKQVFYLRNRFTARYFSQNNTYHINTTVDYVTQHEKQVNFENFVVCQSKSLY